MAFLRMIELDLLGKKVLIREDFNVPVSGGRVTSDARLQAGLPTIRAALGAGAETVILMSHLGRPEEGVVDPAYSMAPIANWLADALGESVQLLDSLDASAVKQRLVVLENVRFNRGEGKNDPVLAQKYAALCDVFVMDAFGTAHRAQASTAGVAAAAPIACAGPLLSDELDALAKVLTDPARPLVAVVGGSKVSTKLTVLEALCEKVDQLVVGGGIANTFLAAAGYKVGKSLHEAGMLDTARELMKRVNIPLPADLVVASAFAADAEARIVARDQVGDDDMILDIGPRARAELTAVMANAGTILWNGPVGVFEFDAFAEGTKALAEAIAASSAFSVAGGGDTLAAIDKFDTAAGVSYISTGGGAFLEFVEGKELPAVTALIAAAAKQI